MARNEDPKREKIMYIKYPNKENDADVQIQTRTKHYQNTSIVQAKHLELVLAELWKKEFMKQYLILQSLGDVKQSLGDFN
jgi:hypothetical protein